MTPADDAADAARARVAVFAGPTATMLNTPPLVTSDQARRRHGLAPRSGTARADLLAPQRLAAPVTVYIEAFTAHPLEQDARDLYAPPDGYVDPDGDFSADRRGPDDVPVHVAELRPEDGLYLLPYMARRADGGPWEGPGTSPDADPGGTRQTFYPDAARLVEEIDRFGLSDAGHNGLLAARANLTFLRPVPSGGYGRAAAPTRVTGAGAPDRQASDGRDEHVAPERWGHDFFPYTPRHLAAGPRRGDLARAANAVQEAIDTAGYDGIVWIEGSPAVDETLYWLGLLVDAQVPLCGVASQRRHGGVGNEGDRNLIDAVELISSGAWRATDGSDRLGAVLVQDQQILAARDAVKVDARPGGFSTAGGHGGVLGSVGGPGGPVIAYLPARAHTATSALTLNRLSPAVPGVSRHGGSVLVDTPILDDRGRLLPEAVPTVLTCRYLRYGVEDGEVTDTTVDTLVDHLAGRPLAGLVLEGNAPYGRCDPPMARSLRRAALSGRVVISVGRGTTGGFTARRPADLVVSGTNLTPGKARLLLTACLLRVGAPPPAVDSDAPTPEEIGQVAAHLDRIQQIVDTH